MSMKTGKTVLYKEVASRMAVMIENGTYRPGERVPSLRALSRQMRVSINTVMEAYANLENRGVIESRPQSGYYVRPRLARRETSSVRKASGGSVAPSPVVIGDVPLQVMRNVADTSLVPLGGGTPNPDLLPADKLNRMMAVEIRRFHSLSVSYAAAQGLKRLRTQIAKRSLDAGCALSADDILITSGCKEAMMLALQAICRPGDTVAVTSPVYYSFLNAIQWMGLKIIEIPSSPREGMNIEVLEYAIRNNPVHVCMDIANFNNPLGSLMPEAKKRHLVELLAKYEIPLIEDDVFGDLAFSHHRPSALKAYDRKGLVLYCSSFSKTLAPGYRIGWIAPGRFHQQVEKLKALFNIATATPTQLAVAEFLTNGGYDHHLRRIQRIYARQVACARDKISRHFPQGTRVTDPEGGFLLWVELPEGIHAIRLYEKALNEGIGIAPGPIFTCSDRYGNCIRLNAAFWSERIERAIETLGAFAFSERDGSAPPP